jgi:hypothetical protein
MIESEKVVAEIGYKGKTVDMDDAIAETEQRASCVRPEMQMFVERLDISMTGLYPVLKGTIRLPVVGDQDGRGKPASKVIVLVLDSHDVAVRDLCQRLKSQARAELERR